MKSRLLIFLSILLLVAVLAALNAASYVRVERETETELLPDRSTLNSGGTGTRALFEYLREGGADVARWGHPMNALSGPERPETLVIVGPTRHTVEPREATAVLNWVSTGGRLVLIDREPSYLLLPHVARWRVFAEAVEFPDTESDPYNAENVTRGVPLLAPAQRLGGDALALRLAPANRPHRRAPATRQRHRPARPAHPDARRGGRLLG